MLWTQGTSLVTPASRSASADGRLTAPFVQNCCSPKILDNLFLHLRPSDQEPTEYKQNILEFLYCRTDFFTLVLRNQRWEYTLKPGALRCRANNWADLQSLMKHKHWGHSAPGMLESKSNCQQNKTKKQRKKMQPSRKKNCILFSSLKINRLLKFKLMQALQSQTDILERRLQLREGNSSDFQACVATLNGLRAPTSTSQSILFLPHQPLSPPSPSHALTLHAMLCTEKEEQKVPFHPLQGPFLRAIGFQHKGLVPAAAPSKFCQCFPSAPTCGSGSHQKLGGQGRASPKVVSQQLPQAGAQHWVWITEKGKSAGALACAKAAGSCRKNPCARCEGGLRDSMVCNLGRGKGLPLRHATA